LDLNSIYFIFILPNINPMLRIYFLLALVFGNCCSYGQWVSDPGLNNHITRTTYEDYLIKAVSDGANGSIFICSDIANDGNIYAQKINAVGQVQWTNILTPTGVVSTNDSKYDVTAVADGSGGVFIAWSDYRHNQFNGEIYIQRINNAGLVQWTAGGVRLTSTNTQDDLLPVVNTDGAGGMLVGWLMNDDNGNNLQSYVQRINGAGTALWAANGVQVSTAAGFRVITSLVKDGSGGLFAVFDDTRNDPNGLNYDYVLNNTLANIDIYGQHISSTGSLLWGNNAIVMANGVGNQSELKAGLIEDGSGGFMFAYSDGRNDDGSFSNIDVFAQRINSAGAPQWAGGTAVSTATFNQSLFKTISDGAGGIVVSIYEEFSGACGLQKLNAAGTALWTANGVPASPLDEIVFNVDLLTDAGGNIIIGFNTSSANYILLQKLDLTGNLLWGAGGKTVCNSPGSFANSLNLVLSDNGSVITGWTDFRNAVTNVLADVFCSKILSDGTIAGLPAYATVANGTWENPASWVGGIMPNNGVPVIVRHTISSSTNIICGSITLEQNTGQLNFAPTARLLSLK
jgi:hypothetical protein